MAWCPLESFSTKTLLRLGSTGREASGLLSSVEIPESRIDSSQTLRSNLSDSFGFGKGEVTGGVIGVADSGLPVSPVAVPVRLWDDRAGDG